MKTIVLKNKIELIGTSAYLIDSNDLIIGDLHLGIERSFMEGGVSLESTNLELLIQNINEYIDFITKKYEIKKINKLIINGDLKHDFGDIKEFEWASIKKFHSEFKDKFNKVILIKGNHDNYAYKLEKELGIELRDFLQVNDILITHGDEIIETNYADIDYIICGHIHPAITLTDELRTEKYKVHIMGPVHKPSIVQKLIQNTSKHIEIKDDIKLLVLCSSHYLTIGTDINEPSDDFCPYLPEDLSKYHIFAVEKDVLNFGTFSELQ